MEFAVKEFVELTNAQLYDILKIRAEVFVAGQNNCYCDPDGRDGESIHFFIKNCDGIQAYLRAYFESEAKDAVKISRVISLCKGHGRQLIEKTASYFKENTQCEKIYVSAQKHAVGFYEKCGFYVTSGDFFEDGIERVRMELDLKR